MVWYVLTQIWKIQSILMFSLNDKYTKFESFANQIENFSCSRIGRKQRFIAIGRNLEKCSLLVWFKM